ncbi:DinB family protein, partial [Bacillus cereus]|nr:DinB family protein [Bacillus cereus]
MEHFLKKTNDSLNRWFYVYPALTGSKTHTSKFSGSKEVRW